MNSGWHGPLACCFGRRARNLLQAIDASPFAIRYRPSFRNEIRRDAEFDGRDARSTRCAHWMLGVEC